MNLTRSIFCSSSHSISRFSSKQQKLSRSLFTRIFNSNFTANQTQGNKYNFKHSDWTLNNNTLSSDSSNSYHHSIYNHHFSTKSHDSTSEAKPIENVVIIGSGSAGLTAAIYNARANLTPLVIEGEQPGGQLTITSDVENFPGFDEPIVGPKLMETMRKQALKFGTRYIQANVTNVDLQNRPFTITLSNDQTIKTHSIIIATGAVAKWLNVPGESKYQGKGVSACATCDGFFFKNKDIAVIGGGDTALEEATFLTRFANSVTLIHRRDTLRASAAMQQKAKNNPKIKFLWNHAVKEICGDSKHKVSHLILQSTKDNSEQQLKVQGIFVAIGHEPNSKLFKGQLKMDEQGYLLKKRGDKTYTDIDGVFVAGDVSDHVYRQAITAAGQGCQAAIDAQHYLEANSLA